MSAAKSAKKAWPNIASNPEFSAVFATGLKKFKSEKFRQTIQKMQ
jgi:hypothetical protein